MPDPREASGEDVGRQAALGIVGAGQLARMTCEAASALGITVAVLAERLDDAAVDPAGLVLHGSPKVAEELGALADACAVMTFDHELVDLDLLSELAQKGHVIRPGVPALEMAVDKSIMRRRLGEAGLPMPEWALVSEAPRNGGPADGLEHAEAVIDSFASARGWPVVLKATRGGYDGKGVWPVVDSKEATEVCREAERHGTALLVEEMVAIDAELACMVARRPAGESVAWPVVETAQVDGVCREVLVPGRIGTDLAEVADPAALLAVQVAEVVGSVGVLAVEMFWTGDRLLVNEVATRPHNSGHWTIEGAITSQFENHVRAVLDLPLGRTAPTASHIASVNVFGAEHGMTPTEKLAEVLTVPDAHVHLYGKTTRPGRKLGHVTVCGEDATEVRKRAWAAARMLGTPIPVTPSTVVPKNGVST